MAASRASVVLVLLTGCTTQERAIVDPTVATAPVPDMGAGCPKDLPASCPSDPPSWAGTVQALITERCGACHRPNGLASDHSFDSYAQVYGHRAPILTQVYSCYMPPPDAGQLAPSERQRLLGWLVCGAPQD
jgi:hypothetical protein